MKQYCVKCGNPVSPKKIYNPLTGRISTSFSRFCNVCESKESRKYNLCRPTNLDRETKKKTK